jgi:uncharacterized protein DUF1592/uncharacterized protein DUF1588/uncharacterized protein DUF1587/uncharacterized protein DUF1585/uncharacterized protein DUF1595/cytochrome c
MRRPVRVGRLLLTIAAAVLVPAGGTIAQSSAPAADAAAPWSGERALVKQYCVTCHNARTKAGGLLLDELDVAQLAEHPAVWEKVVRKLRAGMMPPAGARRPDRNVVVHFAETLEHALDTAAADKPDPGTASLHRLNRTEYANAVRDLLDLPVNAASLLPGDDSSDGFDNIANVLSVSPALMQAYVSAAAKISRLAVGDLTISPAIDTYLAPRNLSQAEHLEGQPLGTRGGILVRHVFPLDAEYDIRVARSGAGFGLPAVGADEPLELTLNGERLRLLERDAPPTVRLRLPAGPQTLGVAIVQKKSARGVDDLFSELATSAGIQSLSIAGPLNPTGPGDTPSRRRLFVCRPAAAKDEPACARNILTTLARRAFRRGMPDAATVDMLMGFYESGRALRGFETGIQYALARVLVDPRFIFRFEPDPAGLAPGAVYPVNDFELASRLSFFLWSSAPDDELLSAAEAGKFANPGELEHQARRMLADPRARALVDNFAGQWLLLRQLDDVSPATKAFDSQLRQSFRRETEMLFESILREDRSVTDLLDADYTFVDERLARHYGIPNIRGSRFRRVQLTDDRRRGLLGQGSFLTVTSTGTRTSPVKRGKWVLENLLGAPVPNPPPGVETNLDDKPGSAAPASLRQRLERHRANPSCAACHNIMDPIGFALENFDLIGQWRDADGGQAVNPKGRLMDGTDLDGPSSLRGALLAHRREFVATVSEKLLTYALGRSLEYFDMPTVRAITRGAAHEDDRFSSLIVGVVKSEPFRMKKKPA